jgi:heavy metal sensor kinase
VTAPIRVRLTAWYAVLLAAIVIALGAFLVLQLRGDLRGRIESEVRLASDQIGRGYEDEGPEDFIDVSRTVLPPGRGAAQIINPSGRVMYTYGPVAGARPMVGAGVRAAALGDEPRLLDVDLGPGRDEHYLALATAVERKGRRSVLVVAESLEEVEESVDRVLALLLLAGPAALAATALGGWWLARKALRPVERMTSEAAEIGIDRLDERIAVPRTADEIGKLAVTLNAMLDRLQRGVEEKHRLVADASHELRTPLAVMRTELDVSLRERDLAPRAREVLESAREEVDGMSRTVDNLLTLAQVDEGRLKLLTGRVRLDEAIDAAVGPLLPLAAAKGIRVEIGGVSSEAEADPHRLHQVLANYVDNAIKYTRPGGEVRVTSWRRDGEVGVTVTDDGPGIPAHDRMHVFDRFFRVDRARGRGVGGSGLGLAICREIAAAHGGRVWVESEEGRGSAFSVALPDRVKILPSAVGQAGVA